MPLLDNARLFHSKLITEKVAAFTLPPDFDHRLKVAAKWAQMAKSGSLLNRTESNLKPSFIERIFGEVLGYRLPDRDRDGEFHCLPETRTSPSGQADAALGYFYHDSPRKHLEVVAVPIELKDGGKDLDWVDPATRRSAVGQLFDYISDRAETVQFGMVSNFIEIRLYSKQYLRQRYEVFRLETLDDPEELKRFIFICGPDRQLPLPGKEPRALELLRDTELKEQDITNKFYRSYKLRREGLFEDLRVVNPEDEVSDELLLEKTQKIIDRVLFILFAEDRELIPANSLARQMSVSAAGFSNWNKLQTLFRAIDEGWNGEYNITRYNGKLFAPDKELDAIVVKEPNLGSLDFRDWAENDFNSDVSVRVLGRIFEQSIADIEKQKALFKGVKLQAAGRRKREGVYYTPAFITSEVIRYCLGQWLSERESELALRFEEDRLAIKLSLRDLLDSIALLDPACGSGAFLVAALDALVDAQHSLDLDLAELDASSCRGLSRTELGRRVLERNLYGVDLNAESVEITKLSLWLHTAEKGSLLTELDERICCGDSLISDRDVSEHAFDWEGAFPEVMGRGGFDLIVGNPPYVKLQNFRRLQPKGAAHLRTTYRSAAKGNFDLYLPFIERGLQLLHPQGWMGYIAPSLWLKNEYGQGLRNIVSETRRLRHWVDFRDQQVFEDVTTYTALQFFGPSGNMISCERPVLIKGEGRASIGLEPGVSFAQAYQDLRPPNTLWSFLMPEEIEVVAQMLDSSAPLYKVSGVIFQGLITSANEVYHFKRSGYGRFISEAAGECELEEDQMLKLLSGDELQRYVAPTTANRILFPYRSGDNGWELVPWEELPHKTAAYLQRFERQLRDREKQEATAERPASVPFDDANWYRFGRNQNIDKQNLPKLCVAQTVSRLSVTFDSEGDCGIDNVRVNGILPGEANPYFLLGVLNSAPCNWYFKLFAAPKGGGYYEANKQYIENLPIPKANDGQVARVAELARELMEGHTAQRRRLGEFVHEFERDVLPEKVKVPDEMFDWPSPDFTFRTLLSLAQRCSRKIEGDVVHVRRVKGKDRSFKTYPYRQWDMGGALRSEWERRLQAAQEKYGEIQARLEVFERELDMLVCELYGLSATQQKLVGHLPV